MPKDKFNEIDGEFIPGLCQLVSGSTHQAQQRIEDIYGSLELDAVLAIEKIIKLEQEFPGLVHPRLLDHLDVLADSARSGKYGLNSWRDPGVFKHKDNYASIGRHVAEGYSGKLKDDESGRNPELHGAVRLMMSHTLKCLNQDKDKETDITEYLKGTDRSI